MLVNFIEFASCMGAMKTMALRLGNDNLGTGGEAFYVRLIRPKIHQEQSAVDITQDPHR